MGMFDWYWDLRRYFKYHRDFQAELLTHRYGFFSRVYPYDKYPEGTHFVYKNLVAAKTGLIAGIGTWMIDIIHITRPSTVTGAVLRIPRHWGVGLAMGSAWASTIWFCTNMRGKDDSLNFVLAGLPCGAIMALRSGNPRSMFVNFAVIGGLGGLWKFTQNLGMGQVVPDMKTLRGDFDRMSDWERSEPYNGYEMYRTLDNQRKYDFRCGLQRYFKRFNKHEKRRMREAEEARLLANGGEKQSWRSKWAEKRAWENAAVEKRQRLEVEARQRAIEEAEELRQQRLENGRRRALEA